MEWDAQDSPHSEPTRRYLTSFVGRSSELHELRSLLEGTPGFVTLWGPAGMGKTRLASAVLSDWRQRKETAFFCDLRTATDVRSAAETLARSLAHHVSQTDAPDTLVRETGESLRAHGRCLVVLDNFEQLVDREPYPLLQWTRLAPDARFLVTSRRVLRLAGEQLYELRPLALPASPADVDSTAAQLFVERARNIEPGFRTDTQNPSDLVELVNLIGGRPLALELGAGLMRRQSVRDAIAHLKQSSLDLRNEDRSCDPRHATLRAAIQSSWNLLTPVERHTAAQLTVFRGSFSLEAAAAVVELPRGAPSIANVIESLREASLLRMMGSTHRRWALYEATHEFAEQQTSGVGAVHERHAAHYATAAASYLERLHTSRSLETRETLDHERANLEAAYDWFRARETAPNRLVPIALALDAAHRERMPSKAARILDDALGFVREGSSDFPRLMIARAGALRDAGQPEASSRALDRSRHAASTQPRDRGEHALEEGRLRYFEGDVHSARALLEHSLRVAREAGLPHLEARAHAWLGWVLAEGFDDPRAFEHYGQALALFEDAGDKYLLATTQGAQNCHRLFFQYPTAKADFERQCELAQRYEDRLNETRGRLGLGIWFHERANLEEAKLHFEQAMQSAQQAGLRREEAIATYRLGTVYDELDDGAQAIAHYEKGITLYQLSGARRLANIARALLSGRLAREGDSAGAESLISRTSEEEPSNTGLRRLIEIQRQRVRLAASRSAELRGSTATAERLRRRSSKALQTFAHRAEAESRPSEFDRFALRLWERDLRELTAVRPELVLWAGAAAFQIGQQRRVSLVSSPVTRRVLQALAVGRRQQPGKSLDVDDILHAAWPEERIAPAAGALRVQNAVKSLRRQGLRRLILTDEGGFYLDPAVQLVEVDSKTA